MEIEFIITKLKSLGYREEDILDIHVNGNPVPSIKTICETKTVLQHAAKILGDGGRTLQASTATSTSGSNHTCTRKTVTTAPAGVAQAGGRTVGGQGGVQSAHAQLGSLAGMVTPQRQEQPKHVNVVSAVTPHQFGLTPFQSML